MENMKNMKILLIDVNCKYSSTGKIVYDLYGQLRKGGDPAKICYGRGPLVVEPDIVKFSSSVEMLIHAGLSMLTGLNGYFSFFATRRLLREIDSFRPDIVHIHDPKTYYMNIGPLVHHLAKMKIPVVWTFHSEYMYTGKCGYANECLKWQSKCGKCPALRRYPRSLFFDFTSKMLNDKKKWIQELPVLHIVSPSSWLGNRVKQSFLRDYPVSVINNGIDTSVFHRHDVGDLIQKNRMTGKKIILSVAPDIMNERKGGTWCLKLAETMKDVSNVHFILVGCSDVEKLPPAENVTYLPLIRDQISLAKYYSMADIFLICSYRENFPTTCLEAQCCGAPIIGFNTGGTSETMVDTACMKLVPFGDIESLKKSAEYFLSFFKEQDHQNLSQKAIEKFAKETMYKNYHQLYQEILH